MQVKPLAASAQKAKSISQDHYSAVTGSDYTTHPWNILIVREKNYPV